MSHKIRIESLACGAGDIKLTWKADDPMEVERAKRVVVDMLRRGYALFIQGADGTMTRVAAFDEKTGCYLIAAGPEFQEPSPEPARVTGNVDAALETKSTLGGKGEYPDKTSDPGAGIPPKRGRGRPRKAIKMKDAKVVAVGRSAGG